MSKYTEAMTLEQRLARMEAYLDIQNVMSRYAYYHTAGRHEECVELFALDTEDTWSEMTWGRYCGREGIAKLYPGYHVWTDGDAKGKMHVHAPCQPYIEVAADGKTARGIWIAPGHETSSFVRPDTNEAFWCWMKYDCDFILENGEWKIWHMRTPGMFMTPYGKPWTEPAMSAEMFEGGPPMPEDYYPDEPPIGANWEYASDKVYPSNDPEVPPRYNTWSEREWPNRDNSKGKPVSPLAKKK
jgi:hypothetical protein